MKKKMREEVFRERDVLELVSHMDAQNQHVVHVKCTFQSESELFMVQVCVPHQLRFPVGEWLRGFHHQVPTAEACCSTRFLGPLGGGGRSMLQHVAAP